MNIDDALEQARNNPETADWDALTACAKGALEAALEAADPGQAARAGELLEIIAQDPHQPEPPPNRAAAILAACAYGLAGDEEAAGRVVRENRLMSALLTSGELAAVGICSGADCEQALRTLPRLDRHREAVLAHRMGDRDRRDRALMSIARDTRNPWDRRLMRIISRTSCGEG